MGQPAVGHQGFHGSVSVGRPLHLRPIGRAARCGEIWTSCLFAAQILGILARCSTLFHTEARLLQGGDLVHVLLAMLVTAIFMALFVVSAIVHENAYSLLAVVVLSTLVVVRVAYYAVRSCCAVISGQLLTSH